MKKILISFAILLCLLIFPVYSQQSEPKKETSSTPTQKKEGTKEKKDSKKKSSQSSKNKESKKNKEAKASKENESKPTEEPPIPIPEEKPVWTPIFTGIDASELFFDEPLMKVFAARVDLKAKGISFKATVPNKDFLPEKRETYRQKTTEFLLENNLALAVNGNFYSPFNSETIKNPGDSNLLGLAVCDGFVESQPQPGFPSFTIKKDGTPEIRDYAPEEDLSEIWQAVSGNVIVLRQGEVVPQGDKAFHPRTAVGISQDQRYVYFIVIDGRQKKWSNGATYEMVGKILKYFGSYDGLNLDGGGSTTMVARGDEGDAVVINHPINSTEDKLRQNGNAIGVAAKPLSRTQRNRSR